MANSGGEAGVNVKELREMAGESEGGFPGFSLRQYAEGAPVNIKII